MRHLEIFFNLLFMILIFVILYFKGETPLDTLSQYVSLFSFLLLIIGLGLITRLVLTRKLPPAAPKSDFLLSKKISFLVLKKNKWDILAFLGLPFVFLVENLERTWWFFAYVFVSLVALWLFRIINFERYLNEK